MSEKVDAGAGQATELLSSTHDGSPEDVFPTLYRSMIFMVISIVLIECFIEIVIVEYFPVSVGYHILFDSGLMVIILSPLVYHFLYRPYKRHHEHHCAAQAQIHYLSRQLINISEKERKHLSQNLHDGFGQILTTMQFGVETIKCSCLADKNKNVACLMHTEKLSQQISDLGDFVRDVSTILHPHMLEELGLNTTLEWHLEKFKSQHEEIEVELSIPETAIRFPAEIELAIFRICQESLNNISKHAIAKKINLSLKFDDNFINIIIEDDGEGFDLSELMSLGAKRSGIGLLGMRERVDDLGGHLHLDSSPGKGTSIHAKIPTELRRRKSETYTSPNC